MACRIWWFSVFCYGHGVQPKQWSFFSLCICYPDLLRGRQTANQVVGIVTWYIAREQRIISYLADPTNQTFQQHTTTVTRKQTFKHRHARCKLKKGTWRRSGPEHACGLHRSTALALWRGGEKLGRWRRHELWRGREGRGADIKVWTSLPELAQGHVLLCVFLHHLGHRHLKVLLGNMYPSLAQGKHSSFCADRLNNKNGQMVSYFASARSASKKYQYSTETHRYALRNWSDSFWGHIICKFAIPGRPKFASTKKLLAQVIWI